MEELKPNSHKYKQEQKELPDKKVERVVSTPVKRNKKSALLSLADIFIPSDLNNLKEHLINDVLRPKIEDTIVELVTDGIKLLVYKDTKKRKKKSGVYIDYTDRFGGGVSSSSTRNRGRQRYNPDEIIIDSRGEAEDVRDQLLAIIEKYHLATVGDFYELVGESTESTDFKYGWTSLNTAEIVRARQGGGYVIKLPRPIPID